MCALPLPTFPTGIMRPRFHPTDGQLYVCGMFAWAGNQSRPGGFYSVRHTGKPTDLPVGLKARTGGVELTFSDALGTRIECDNIRPVSPRTCTAIRTGEGPPNNSLDDPALCRDTEINPRARG